jgi:hypothetical protein
VNKIEQKFIDKGLVIMQPNDKWFVMSKKNSIEFIEACKNAGIEILGIDGFYLREKGIQPSMANSIDFSSISYKGSKDFYAEAIAFLNTKDENLYFEIVCSD